MKPVRCFLFLLLSVLLAVSADAAPFRPSGPSLGASSLRPGMKGHALTVVSGREIIRFPVEIVSIIPRKGSPRNLIMVRASGPVIAKTGGIAAGMSGSPVYVNGKLIGAIGYGWNFSEHNLGLVTPLEDMASIWDWPEKKVVLPGLPPLGTGPAEDDNDQKEEKPENSRKETRRKKRTKKRTGRCCREKYHLFSLTGSAPEKPRNSPLSWERNGMFREEAFQKTSPSK